MLIRQGVMCEGAEAARGAGGRNGGVKRLFPAATVCRGRDVFEDIDTGAVVPTRLSIMARSEKLKGLNLLYK